MSYQEAVSLTVFIIVAGFLAFGGVGIVTSAIAYSQLPKTSVASSTTTSVEYIPLV